MSSVAYLLFLPSGAGALLSLVAAPRLACRALGRCAKVSGTLYLFGAGLLLSLIPGRELADRLQRALERTPPDARVSRLRRFQAELAEFVELPLDGLDPELLHEGLGRDGARAVLLGFLESSEPPR